ncbi:MAG: hypothetical protein H8E41_05790 [Desulfobulbaceae bacterium]|uniref:Uncharacterized protein n=1 Tax=Candidatus Desulfobia pelagia TaxID=2841692 RepID=A0A8J6ND64_9BACT|nr:hypothetical protein [Candidatus Desulfobia pelagia]
MKIFKMLFFAAITILTIAPASSARDFSWARDFNLQAQADPSGIRARLATRFNIGHLQVRTVLSNVENPADAYMVLRLGEMSGRPTDYIVERYRSGKKKGWGSLAKSLGIKPGSQEFHALKRGHDLSHISGAAHNTGNYVEVSYNNEEDGGKGKKKGKSKKNGK